jgi:hypothetical protein
VVGAGCPGVFITAPSGVAGPTVVGEMPANLTPEYKAAEAEFRQARTPEDRLSWMGEMLRTIREHKGTSIDDFVIDNHDRPVTDVAHEVLARAGWL